MRQFMTSVFIFTSVGFASSTNAQIGFQPEPFLPPNASDYSNLGASSCIYGDRVYFGAPGTNPLGVDAGAAYGFDMDEPMNTPLALTHPDIDANDRFGASVAGRRWSYGDGNILSVIVGAPNDEGPNGDQGRAYFFDYNTSFMHSLTAPDGQPGDEFGQALGVFEEAVVVGAPAVKNTSGYPQGEVHYFAQTPTDLTHSMVLVPSGQFDFAFGAAISTNRYRFLVGAPGIPDGQPSPGPISTRGSAYLYNPGGEQIRRLTAPVRNNDAHFGASIAQGDRFEFVIGAPGDSVIANNAGAAYFWDHGNGEGAGITIAPAELDPDDSFGYAVAINDNFVLVGAPGDDDAGVNAGAVYLFDLGTLALVQKITPSGLGGDLSNMRFGSSLSAYNEDNIAVGAEGLDGRGQTYRLQNTCMIDFNYNAQLDFFDVSAFIFVQPDLTMDGEFNFFDVSMFLNLYTSGCH